MFCRPDWWFWCLYSYPYILNTLTMSSSCNWVLFSELDTHFTKCYLIVFKVSTFKFFSSLFLFHKDHLSPIHTSVVFLTSHSPLPGCLKQLWRKIIYQRTYSYQKYGQEVLLKKPEEPVAELLTPVDWPSLPVSENIEMSLFLASFIPPVNNSLVAW